MRRMRACATANALVSGLLLGVLSFAACSSGSAPTPPPSTPPAPDAVAASDPALTAKPADTAAAPPQKARPKPQSVADCKQIMSEIVNAPPDGGVVMNNAMTAGDAGRSDRFQPMTDLIKSKNDAYRCCFDLWAKNHADAAGREVPIKVVWNLKPDGTLDKTEIDTTASQLDDPEVNGCMNDLSKTLTYPPSPSGKITKFTYTFLFKIRR
jgi:hypothetical protein